MTGIQLSSSDHLPYLRYQACARSKASGLMGNHRRPWKRTASRPIHQLINDPRTLPRLATTTRPTAEPPSSSNATSTASDCAGSRVAAISDTTKSEK